MPMCNPVSFLLQFDEPIASFDVHQEYQLLYTCTVDGTLYRDRLVGDGAGTRDRAILRRPSLGRVKVRNLVKGTVS